MATLTQLTLAADGTIGAKTQWDSAVILFTWTYSKNAAPDHVTIALFGEYV